MRSVGIRELRQNASAIVRHVVSGETVEVTDRGHPVARIVPLRVGEGLDQLIAEGRATAATGDLLDIVELPPQSPSLSEALADMRADER